MPRFPSFAVPVDDTIVALATPPGRSGIGVVRLSGPGVRKIAQHLVRDEDFSPEPNHATLKNLYDPDSGDLLDQAILTYFKAPHSFTGEDAIEFSCHGSPVVLRQLVDVTLKLNARLAGPGEFTLRALSNGKLNLSQAEAIRDLINAQTRAAVQQATRQLGGELSATLTPIKEALLEIIVPLESALEFVEDDLPDIAFEQVRLKLAGLITQVDDLALTFKSGRLIRDGLKITLVGRPNVGKSSIFNKLAASDRAIVTEIPGTTRDSLSEMISLNNVPILLTDTAGLRNSTDRIEILGIERTKRAIADADLIIVVLDGSQPLTLEDHEVLDEVSEKMFLIAVNKNDLNHFDQGDLKWNGKATSIISLSAKTGVGLDALKTAILEPFAGSDIDNEGLLITDARHFDLLQRTRSSLSTSKALFEEHVSEELVLVGLYDALKFLGEITGETTPDDVLSQIFSTFCIGK